MNTAIKVAGFALGLAVVFGGAAGVGAAVEEAGYEVAGA